MEKLAIVGGNKLTGTIRISGSKNSSLPIIFASLLTDEEVILENVPNLKDIDTALQIIKYLGKKVVFDKNLLKISYSHAPPKDGGYITAPYELVKKMRASFLVSGALLARNKKVRVALPGGCAIGVRPVDIHIKAFEEFGCKHQLDEGYVLFFRDELKPAKIKLRFPSVGATEDIMLLASAIDGTTQIINAAREPEIVDLAGFLGKLGVEIRGAGESVIYINGKRKLSKCATLHRIIPDRIEAGSFMIAIAATRGDAVILDVVWQHCNSLISKLRKCGVMVDICGSSIRIKWQGDLKPQNIKTEPFPGFPTDLQAQFMTLMCLAKGESIIKENIFENRFVHAAELQRMGANIVVQGNTARVSGVSLLKGCEVMVSDLRAGAALVIAGLVAEGLTTVSHIYHLDRGYENLETKFANLGANIKRIK